MRGNNKSIRQNLIENTTSHEFRELRRAIAKRQDDRARAIETLYRRYAVAGFDGLPAPIKSAVLSSLASL